MRDYDYHDNSYYDDEEDFGNSESVPMNYEETENTGVKNKVVVTTIIVCMAVCLTNFIKPIRDYIEAADTHIVIRLGYFIVWIIATIIMVLALIMNAKDIAEIIEEAFSSLTCLKLGQINKPFMSDGYVGTRHSRTRKSAQRANRERNRTRRTESKVEPAPERTQSIQSTRSDRSSYGGQRKTSNYVRGSTASRSSRQWNSKLRDSLYG